MVTGSATAQPGGAGYPHDAMEVPRFGELAEDDEIYETESPSDSGTEGLTWISWFCSLTGHQYFAEVAEEFIEDDFNLTGLNILVPFYKEALEMILDVEPRAFVLTRRRLAQDPGRFHRRIIS